MRRSVLARITLSLMCAAALGSAQAQPGGQFSPDYKPLDASTFVPGEKEANEGELRLPSFPRREALIEFEVSALSSFRFFIDSESIVPGHVDGIVRYTLVGRSSAGVENISFNGLRCKTGEHKLYATGRASDQGWSVARDSKWRPVEARTVTRQHLVLLRDFFCPAAVAIRSREEGVNALKSGYHPHAVSNHPTSR